MTSFTINAGGTTKWDSLSGGSINATLDDYTISNNTTLLIETDTHQCAGHTTAAGSLDSLTFSGLGGKLKLDGNNVRVIPYNTGASTVPAIGTTISRSGVSSKLLGVWANWQSEPVAAGAAMPASGFIKVKDKTGGTFSAGALTGISASATGADVVGWIEVRGADTASITVPRLGAFEVSGDFFELGTTNGTRGQVLACPTTASVAGVFPGVQIETAVASGVYEWYFGAGSLAASSSLPTDAYRAKMVWQTTSGIRIGSDGANNVGYLPVIGLRVRIPNVIMTCCTRSGGGSGIRVLPNSTIDTRMEFSTGGSIVISRGAMQWYAKFRSAHDVSLTDSVFSDNVFAENLSLPVNVQRCCVGITQTQVIDSYAFIMSSILAGGTITDNVVARYSINGSGHYVAFFQDCAGLAMARNKWIGINPRASDYSGSINFFRNRRCSFTDDFLCGGKVYVASCASTTFTRPQFCDRFVGTTDSSNQCAAIDLWEASSDTIIDGFLIPVTNTQPYRCCVRGNNCSGITIRNVGTYASPLSLGSTNQSEFLFASGQGANSNLKFKRVYATGYRSGLISAGNSDRGCLFESVAGAYADNFWGQYGPPFQGIEAVIKGCGFSPDFSFFSGGGSLYGDHWQDGFTSTTAGFVMLMANEGDASTLAECAITSGTPRFNGAGSVLMVTVGDRVEWEMPYYALGHTAFAALAPIFNETPASNLTYEFQWDITGSGYNGTWTAITQANLTGIGAIDPAIGFKLKVRVTCATANVSNELVSIVLRTVTTSSAQSANLYPLTTNALTITGIVSGSRYRVEQVSNGALIGQGTSTGGTDTVTHSFIAPTSARVVVRKSSSAPKYIPSEQFVTLGDYSSSVIVSQIPDTVAL